MPALLAAGYIITQTCACAHTYLPPPPVPCSSSAPQVATRLKGTISSKINGYEDFLSKLVAEACMEVCPKNPHNFNVDNVRVVKIPGSGILESKVIKGMVIKRDAEGTKKGATDAKVAVYSQGVDTSGTETKGTVLIKNAEELENYAK